MGDVDRRAHEIARSQLGLATRAQLRAVISGDSITRRLATGTWQEWLPNVIDLGTHEAGWWQSARALLLGAGAGSVLSHETAAHLHGLPDVTRPRSPDVLVVRGRHAAVGGHRLHTTVRLPACEVEELDGWPVTSGSRAVVDCAPRRSDDWLQLAIARLLRQRRTTLTAVIDSAALRSGAAATARVVRACAGLPPGIDRTESPLEVRGVIALARLGLPTPVLQHRVVLRGDRYRFDAAWPPRRVAAEFDGAAWHDTEIRSGADAIRDGAAGAEGWEVVRFRHADVEAPWRSERVDRLRTLLL